ncbi:type 2 isopentenyl-diphosphate Delta-isomerase [Marinifilum caeruleilacunae]|uniref:Type 2 isopentenyl-diphosphate Delta-isomerase n=1 Tax=Marinifilum caeruleilacunae TaxID=2499076 RepID=A0ABX1WYI1_9BACT|nr:type 2 isopentenyl-diphosphate Delta-isomerase [Marinifilum caeruleilacunae]NOU61082.1 type 2 isopentenyl-diphosphate Delta-isomerase [Marinifilum caeruleilacunae]
MTDRKKDHIDLAFRSQIEQTLLDDRFYYEPFIDSHPQDELKPFTFLGKELRTPIWVSSMTGGTQLAGKINKNLAKACAEFGMGMGLGSCRSLLDSDEHLKDFDVRHIIGADLPLYANLGICQLEELIASKELQKLIDMVGKLEADGLIIHVNPMQEWLQPEGDRILRSPIESIKELLRSVDFPIIVKEVGQGFGPESLKQLLRLPLQAIEFAAFGGTNFAKIEMLRNPDAQVQLFEPLAKIGHSAEQMLNWTNEIVESNKHIKCKEIIISGGIHSFIDGYYLTEKSKLPAIYGQASQLLKYARESYEDLQKYLHTQVEGLKISKTYLKVK